MTVGGQNKHDTNKILSTSRHTGKPFEVKIKPCSVIIQKANLFITHDKARQAKLVKSKTL